MRYSGRIGRRNFYCWLQVQPPCHAGAVFDRHSFKSKFPSTLNKGQSPRQLIVWTDFGRDARNVVTRFTVLGFMCPFITLHLHPSWNGTQSI